MANPILRRYHIRSTSRYGSNPNFFEDILEDKLDDNFIQDDPNVPHEIRPKRHISNEQLEHQSFSEKVRVEMEYKEFSSETRSELVISSDESHTRDQELLDHLDCGPTKCTHMICTIGPLKKKESVVFRIYSRLWSSTISRLSHHQYEISSRLVSIVTKLPHKVDPSFLDIKTYTGMFTCHYTDLGSLM